MSIPIEWLEKMLLPFICNKVLKRDRADLDEFLESEAIQINRAFQNKAKKMVLLPHKRFESKRLTKNIVDEEQK